MFLINIKILTFFKWICDLFVNIEFSERQKAILNQVKRASHFVKIIVACPHRLPKLPESTQRTQALPNKGSLCMLWGSFSCSWDLG
jgi:hypothetical protein